MAEYKYADIIMDPEDPRLDGAIGKECYLSDFPKIVLDVARSNSTVDRLKRIEKEKACPFVNEEEESNWAVIIIKKEEPKPEYTPFKSMEEFVKKYEEVRDIVAFGSFEDSLLRCGLWLKTYDFNTKKPMYAHVSRITCEGIQISDDFFITWEDLLLQGFLFPNDKPCGKSAESK